MSDVIFFFKIDRFCIDTPIGISKEDFPAEYFSVEYSPVEYFPADLADFPADLAECRVRLFFSKRSKCVL